MTRYEFMKELERLLGDVSTEEKEEALKYYEGYFDDAGPENEQQVIKELGSPNRIANMIKRDLRDGSRSYNEKEYTEYGYQDGTEYRYEMSSGKRTNKNNTLNNDATKIVLIVILCIILSPVLTGVFGVIVGLVGTVFGLFIACAALALAFTLGGMVVIAFGLWYLVTSVPIGILLIGVGLLLVGFGILFIILDIWLWGDLLPKLIRWCIQKGNELLHRKEAER